MSGKYKNYINMQTRFTFTTLYLDYFAPIISSLFLYFSICCFNFLLLRHMQGGLYFGIWTQPRAKSRDLQFIQFSYLLFFFRFFLVQIFYYFYHFLSCHISICARGWRLSRTKAPQNLALTITVTWEEKSWTHEYALESSGKYERSAKICIENLHFNSIYISPFHSTFLPKILYIYGSSLVMRYNLY